MNIGQHEGLTTQRLESKTPSNKLFLATPVPWDPLNSLYNNDNTITTINTNTTNTTNTNTTSTTNTRNKKT